LLNVLTAPTANRQVAYLASNSQAYTSYMGSVMSIFLNANSELRVGKNTSSAPASDPTPPLTIGTTNLVVVRYTFVTNDVADDEYALWLNPSPGSLGVAETDVPAHHCLNDGNRFYQPQQLLLRAAK
jgi:hypothetical protein